MIVLKENKFDFIEYRWYTNYNYMTFFMKGVLTLKILARKNTKNASSVVRARSGAMVIKVRKSDTAMSASFRRAVSGAIRTHEENKIPVAKYDGQTKQVYYLHADGSRTYETT